MRKLITSFLLIGSIVVSKSWAQTTVTQMTSFDELNLTDVELLPDGTAFAFSFGSTNSCPNMNVIKSTSFQDNWTYMNQCGPVGWPDPYLTAINSHFFDANTGCVVMSQKFGGYATPKIYKTSDGGATWSVKYTHTVDSGADGISDFAFKDNMDGVAITMEIDNNDVYHSGILRTADGGDSWAAEPVVFDDVSFEKIVCVNGIYYVIGLEIINWDTQGWRVYKSADNGVTWSQVYSEATPIIYDVSMHFISDQIGFIGLQDEVSSGYSHSQVLKTTDGGVNWTPLASTASVLPETMSFNDLHFTNEWNGYVVAGNHCDASACYRGYAILHTQDGGQTWDDLERSPYASFALYDISFDDNAGIGYVSGGDIGTSGGRLFKIDDPTSGINENEEIGESLMVYPNPSTGEITIKTDGKDGVLNIYSVDGRLIHSEEAFAANMTLQLTEGVYHCTFNLENGIQLSSDLITVLK